MKRFYKIFMAVAAVAAVGCTTDATDDLGVNLNEGPTTLTLSLDDTRTQLGDPDKDGDGKVISYPLTWAEGDAISVNGSVSNPLTTNEAGDKTATFTFKNGFGENPESYFIAYPAVDGVANQVMFAAEQTHVSNTTFGNGAAVMYGYATDLSSVKLKHLTGVLKIGVVAPANNANCSLKAVRISTVDRKPIAGAFNVDKEGKLTPVKGATTDVITYTSSKGVDLTDEPTYIHVAVPAGTYDELYVTLVVDEQIENTETENPMDFITAERVMYATVKAPATDNKQLKAGVVREFSLPITFAPINTEDVFVIKDYDSLKKFKEEIEEAQANTNTEVLSKNAVMTNDVVIEGDWTPIYCDTWVGTFKGNGYAISGLNNPLFYRAKATFDGLHLTNVNITGHYDASEDIEDNRIAPLAQTYLGTSIKNCSTSGKIECNIEDGTPVQEVGGIVGMYNHASADAEICNCVNNCVINATITNTGTSTRNIFRVGGMFGRVQGGGHKMVIDNCTNNAPITVGGKRNVNSFLGGIFATSENTELIMTNCTNNGVLNMASIYDGTGVIAFFVGGLAAWAEQKNNYDYACNATNCINNGEIQITGQMNYFGGKIIAGGLFGRITNLTASFTINQCTNNGDISITGTSKGEEYIEGLVGEQYDNNTTISDDSVSSGTITGAK